MVRAIEIPGSLADEIRTLQLEPKEFDLGERIRYIRDGQLMVNLAGLSLTKLPLSILEMDDTHHLELSLNHLSGLPDLSSLGKLISISLRFNSFTEFPVSLFETNLLKINFEENKLRTLPDRFDELKELLFLDLAFNDVIELPPSFSQLGDLMKLDLQRNKFEIFPIEITELLSLRNLDLSSNRLETVPSQLSDLSKMRYLDLSANNLGEIPLALNKFTEMTFFDVSGNENVKIPDKISLVYESKFFANRDKKYTEVQFTRTSKESVVDMTLINRVQERRKNKSIDWDSHFNLESLVAKEDFKANVSVDDYEDRDYYLEQKFLLIDY